MDKLKFRRSGIQARVLALTMFFTLGASLVIAASNMHQMTAEWERTTILNAEYALQTAASAIRRDVDEIDDLAGWCAYNPGMRTYLLTGDTASNQALSMYPTLTAKFNSMRTMAYIQRFLLINASGRQMMFGTAATNAVTLTPDILQRIPGYDSPNTGWDCILRDPLALSSQAANTIPVTHTLTLPGTDRTAHVCIFVSPSLILSPLRSFTLADGGQLYWEMGENLYTINGSLLSALNGSIADFDDAVPLDSNTLDPNTEVYTRGSGSSAQLVVRYPIGIHELYLIEVLPNGPTQRQITFVSVPLLISLTAILLLGCGYWEQQGFFRPEYEKIQDKWYQDEAFMNEVEAAAGDGAMLFTLPYMKNFENGSLNNMWDYTLLRGPLHSKTLKFTYGAGYGTKNDLWYRETSELEPDAMVAELRTQGMTGIYLDLDGYPEDEQQSALAALTEAAGCGPEDVIHSGSGLLCYIPLGQE